MESLCISVVVFLCFGYLGVVEGRLIDCVSSEPSLDCFAHYFNNSTDCFPATLASKFPDLYNLGGEAPPERPSLINLTPFEKQYGSSDIYKGVNVSVQPPITASVNYVRGFELRYSKVDLDGGGSTDQPRCVVFNFSSPLNASLRYTKFSIEVWPMPKGLWPFTVYSLPKDDNSKFRQSAVYITQWGYAKDEPSKKWHTTISYRVDYEDLDIYGTIHYSFYGSAKHDFPAYKVQLYRVDVYHPDREIIIPKDSVTEGHEFSSLRPGKYEIMIEPYLSPNQHACKDESGRESPCTVTKVQIDIGNVTSLPSTTTISTTTTTTNKTTATSASTSTKSTSTLTKTMDQSESSPTMTSSHTTGQSDRSTFVHVAPANQSDKVIAAVLGTVLGVLLLVCSAYFVYCRRRHSQGEDDDNGRNNKAAALCFGIQETGEKQPKLDAPRRSEKTILLTYTMDNKFHENAVQKLGQYLQSRFHTTVSVKQCPVKPDLTVILKLMGYIDKADMFIFICSPKSITLMDENPRNGQTNGVRQLFKCLENKEISAESQRERCLFAAFEYPSPDLFTQHEGFHTESYLLLANLNKLLDHISRCGFKTRTSVSSDQKSSETRDLQKAVSLAVQFYEESMLNEVPLGQLELAPGDPDSGFESFDRPQTQRLDSISNVLQQQQQQQQRGYYHPDISRAISEDSTAGCYVTSHEEFPAMPCQFHPPSDIIPSEDINTVVMHNEIEMFNQRNMYPDRKLYLLHGVDPGGDPGYSYDDDECVSVGSGKSV